MHAIGAAPEPASLDLDVRITHLAVSLDLNSVSHKQLPQLPRKAFQLAIAR